MIGLADCNNFFVSCERTLNPDLCGRAVVVLSNNDGCVVARSNEAKRLGIRMGEPVFRIRDIIEKGDVVAISGNHLLYRDISLRVHDIFRRFAPGTLDYSVDEAFLLMDGVPAEELPVIGEAICEACSREAHIPVTVGFAPSKTLAKIATEAGKKSGRRVVCLDTADKCREVYADMPISDMWGVGRRLAKRLYAEGVYTIGDFADRPMAWVRARLGVVGERSWRELHGQPCIELDFKERQQQDSISETRTFPIDINDFDYLRARISIYCAHVSKRLRDMGGECGEMSVFLQTNRFHTERGFYTPSCGHLFANPTADAVLITEVGVSLLENIYNPTLSYKRAGVLLSQITPMAGLDLSLFAEDNARIEAKRRSRHLMSVVDKLNVGAGPHLLKLASQLTKGHPGHNDGYSSSFGAPLPD